MCLVLHKTQVHVQTSMAQTSLFIPRTCKSSPDQVFA